MNSGQGPASVTGLGCSGGVSAGGSLRDQRGATATVGTGDPGTGGTPADRGYAALFIGRAAPLARVAQATAGFPARTPSWTRTQSDLNRKV